MLRSADMTAPNSLPSVPSVPPQHPSVPPRPVGALILFTIGLAIIGVLMTTSPNEHAGCPTLLSGGYVSDTCDRFLTTRMNWVHLLSIPTVVAGAATVARWPRQIRHAGGGYSIG